MTVSLSWCADFASRATQATVRTSRMTADTTPQPAAGTSQQPVFSKAMPASRDVTRSSTRPRTVAAGSSSTWTRGGRGTTWRRNLTLSGCRLSSRTPATTRVRHPQSAMGCGVFPGMPLIFCKLMAISWCNSAALENEIIRTIDTPGATAVSFYRWQPSPRPRALDLRLFFGYWQRARERARRGCRAYSLIEHGPKVDLRWWP